MPLSEGQGRQHGSNLRGDVPLAASPNTLPYRVVPYFCQHLHIHLFNGVPFTASFALALPLPCHVGVGFSSVLDGWILDVFGFARTTTPLRMIVMVPWWVPPCATAPPPPDTPRRTRVVEL